jgi:transposase
MQAVTIGLDIAKSLFQVHGVDTEGNVIIRRQLKRPQVMPFFKKLAPCLIGIEACATSHHWSRELQALGHTVRLMPPAYVKPYVKRQKNDATDAEAICEAVARPSMRFVETKTTDQQAVLVIHRTRALFMKQQTSLINAIRAHLAEFGIVAPVACQRGAVHTWHTLYPFQYRRPVRPFMEGTRNNNRRLNVAIDFRWAEVNLIGCPHSLRT